MFHSNESKTYDALPVGGFELLQDTRFGISLCFLQKIRNIEPAEDEVLMRHAFCVG